MKSLVGKLGVLVLLAAASSAVVAGCSSSAVPGAEQKAAKEGSQGEVTLGLLPVTGVALNSVHYTVVNATGGVVSEGDLPTPGDAKDISFGLSLPVGSGYTIALSAASADPNDNITCGGSYGPFNVLANTSAAFTLTLTCHDDTSGQTVGNIGVQTDACPRVSFDYIVATPATVAVGKTAAVAAKAHDLDGKVLTYSWKIANPSVGTFSPVTGAVSTFACQNPSTPNQVVTVTADNGECKKSLTTTISCKNIDACGNGVVDPGETCDQVLDPNCPAGCFIECGDGLAVAPIEQCDPGSATNPICTETCQLRPLNVCGDGFINGTEACDHSATNGDKFPAGTPPGVICSADCRAIINVDSPCGDGIVGGVEECDDWTIGSQSSASPKCSNTCQKVSTQACVDCENAGDCFETVDNCLGLGLATPFNLTQQTQCFTVMRCIEQSNCLDGTGSLGSCYCGSITDTAACSAAPFTGPGSPDGKCVKEIQAGFPGVTSNSAILGGLTANGFPAGAAMGRLNCQKIANKSACLSACGLNAGGPVFP
ncbi:MAG TPA: hypothetical protein VER96_31100 [Polyangiaceae bacterium]|nr:hypothetical protein [Polyangiaceae bacterium]